MNYLDAEKAPTESAKKIAINQATLEDRRRFFKGDEMVDLKRMFEMEEEIFQTGSVTHTTKELEEMGELAWIYAGRCPGRNFHRAMEVRDMRHLKTGREVFEASADHIERARKMSGKIIPMLTLYDPSVRIVSPQFFNYAGAVHNGETVGYRNNIEVTELAKERGWKGDTSLPFTLLPFMVSVDGGPVELFDIPSERNGVLFIRETRITHPHPAYKQLATLALHDWVPEDKRGISWYDIPAISNMRMVGGREEYAAQFSGKYSSGEIANNFTHPEKMERVLDKVRPLLVAQSMGDAALRLDRLEGFDGEVYAMLNTAVESSFKRAGFDVATPIQMSDGYFAWTERFEKIHGELPPENPDWLREGGSPAHRTQYYRRRYPTAHIAAPPNAPGFFHPDELAAVSR